MVRKKVKSISFDAMVKFFIQNYNIATKKDIDKLNDKLDSIEKLIKTANTEKGSSASGSQPRGGANPNASDKVLNTIKVSGTKGISFAQIKIKTGYKEKKLRNIIYRMDKLGKIIRKERGIYIIAD